MDIKYANHRRNVINQASTKLKVLLFNIHCSSKEKANHKLEKVFTMHASDKGIVFRIQWYSEDISHACIWKRSSVQNACVYVC